MSVTEILKVLNTNTKNGLSADEAQKRLSENGINIIAKIKKLSLVKRFAEQLSDKMIVILMLSAIISAVMAYFTDNNYADPIIIVAIVFLNATIGVIQESKAERAIEALLKLTSPYTVVLRDGQKIRIPIEEVVTGDIIFIEKGNFVPADARVIESNELITDESALTGESYEVNKYNYIADANAHISDKHNMLFANTIIVGGYGIAVVVKTGMDTYMGGIASLLSGSESPRTPLQVRLAKTGAMLGNAALIICIIIFIVGSIKQIPVIEMFITSVSLAVAAIPEGLPAIVTVMLSIGVQRIAKSKAIVRKLPAVETLGCSNVICSDKTGTLTQNKMSVIEIFGDKDKSLFYCTLCNNNTNPTEAALLTAAEVMKINIKQYTRVKEIQFTSARKLMTTIHKTDSGYLTITKGAPDVLFTISDNADRFIYVEKAMTEKALRVIGVAIRQTHDIPQTPEEGLTIIGLIGLLDPPREEVKDAVASCREAGIKPVMITGDHKNTAIAIAKAVGMYNGHAVTEKELEMMSESECRNAIINSSVFARTTPEYKVKIVTELQKCGSVVAMTGDGINDAPALKQADIGCAMGSGTDVAKEAADLVLTDDNFATIVQAVKCGRGIYENIKKAIHFLLSCNIGEIFTIFVAILAGLATPLTAIQLLWINLVTDSLPAIALGLEPVSADVMKRKPIPKSESLFSNGLFTRIIIEGILIGTLALTAFLIGLLIFDELIIARTMSFAVLGLSQLFHAFNMKSEKPLIKSRVLNNGWLIFSFIICAILQVGVIILPAANSLLSTAQLNIEQWIIIGLLSFAPIPFVDIGKVIIRKLRK
ncbi:MAG: hypothetical protein A2Y17_11710 [Clostridiales bacterium GWF2_38_85]|nr:MAG: hypothetical protein A2Y17_11710 [Clostridiales bacterium GWF2_38_85]